MLPKRIGTLAAAAVCAAAVSACGAGEHAKYADNLGPGYVQVGQLNYQVQISRELNPWDTQEDKWYLQGFTGAERDLPTADEFFGVSMQVFNWSGRAATPSNDFFITDSLGARYTPMTNPNPNPYTYVPESIPAGGRMPSISSAAFAGWSQGAFLVFKIPYASLVDRPFILHIVNPAAPTDQSRIELDV